ncbi:rod shape-determining protein RodA [candidate division KSB1 bacterium]|nr:rod shape-determining protein RodA [candidate division KSB1 bacterium]
MGLFDRKKIDWYFFAMVLLILVFSCLAVYSSTSSSQSLPMRENFNKQLIWIAIGLMLMVLITFVPTRWYRELCYIGYAGLIVSLILLDLIGGSAGSANRWFELGSIKFQPSEFMKPMLVLTLARYLSNDDLDPNRFRTLLTVFGLALLPFALVIKQPDLGTALAFLVVTLPMLYWRGLKPIAIFIIVSPFLTFIASFNFWTFFFSILLISSMLFFSGKSAPVFWSVFFLNILVGILAPQIWSELHPYQQNRILTFLGLVSDPQGAGYQIIQSKVAIGSGGLLGKGFLQGTQTQLRFLPAQHTDFIFSVLAEEWGFVGSLIVLAVFFAFLWRGIGIAAASNDRFGSLSVAGLVTLFAFQVVVNIGMTVGIMPVTGLPLPFISYGGSSMITSLIMAGLIANVSMRRYHYYR